MTDRLHVYRQALSTLAQTMCAPFWWSVKTETDEQARIAGIGTISYVDTGTRKVGVTADHVYRDYLKTLADHGSTAVECQFGSSTVSPENRVIDCSEELDVATFDVPEVFVTASHRSLKAHHSALQWPPRPVRESETVLYGGHPVSLHEEKGHVAELPFQWAAGRVSGVTQDDILFEPKFETMDWQGHERNHQIRGWSGGPVFRAVEDEPITRLELVGFMYVYVAQKIVRARPAHVMLADGHLRGT